MDEQQARLIRKTFYEYFRCDLDYGTHEDWEKEDDLVQVEPDGRLVVKSTEVLLKKQCPSGVLPVRFRSVDGGFVITNGDLQSLEGCPEEVGAYFEADDNPLKSLRGIPGSVYGRVVIPYRRDLGLLPLLTIEGWSRIKFGGEITDLSDSDQNKLLRLIRKYQDTGRNGMIPFAAELHKIGFGGNAKL